MIIFIIALLTIISIILISMWVRYKTIVYFRTVYNAELRDKMENDKYDRQT